jgi:hypothetical protein
MAYDADVIVNKRETPGLTSVAGKALKTSAVFWFVAAVAGQWLFVYYIAAFYGPSTLSGDFEAWNRRDPVMGYVAGDVAGNLVFAAHVLIAGVLTFGGALQLVPQIRARAIAFHRWNGRLFLLAAIAAASGGLYLEWVRGAAFRSGGAGFVEAAGITLDAVLILAFAGLALRAVRAKRIAEHQRWATRLFLVVNGVWFMRIGVAAWMALTPFSAQSFFVFWSFGAILVPLFVYELYLRAQKAAAPAQFAMAVSLVALTLIMGVGSIAAFLIMWRPVLFLSR